MNRKLIPLLVAVLIAGVVLGAVIGRKAAPAAEVTAADPPVLPAPASATPVEGIVFSAVNHGPAATPDLLPSGIPAVYAFFRLTGVKVGADAEISWTHDGKAVGVVAAADVKLDASQPGTGSFVLRAEGGKLRAGIYEVELKAESRRFRASFVVADQAAAILAQKAPPTATLQVTQHVIARGVNQQGEPERPSAKLQAADRVFYVLRYQGAEPGMAMSIRWWRDNVELVTARKDVTLSSEAGWAHAWIQVEGGLPAGKYSATASVAGAAGEIARDQFTIQ